MRACGTTLVALLWRTVPTDGSSVEWLLRLPLQIGNALRGVFQHPARRRQTVNCIARLHQLAWRGGADVLNSTFARRRAGCCRQIRPGSSGRRAPARTIHCVVPTLPAGTRLGPYEILSTLGTGGMGVVYRDVDPRLERQVAIKLLPEEMAADPHARERLRREAMAVAAIDHPYICKIFEIGEHGHALFLVIDDAIPSVPWRRPGRGGLYGCDAERRGRPDAPRIAA